MKWLWDVLALAGLGLVAGGLGWVLHPGMVPLVIGAGMLAAGVLGARREPPEGE